MKVNGTPGTSGPSDDMRKAYGSLIAAPALFQAVVAGVRLKLFATLAAEPNLTRAQLAAKLGLAEHPTRVMLMACCAAGTLTVDAEGRYANAPMGTLLLGDASVHLLSMAELVYPAFASLTESFKENRNVGVETLPGPGATSYERLANVPHLEAVFHGWMKHISKPLPDSFVPREVKKLRHVVDVGGGDGWNAVRLAQAAPETRITILDLPSVCERAQKRIDEAGLTGRVVPHPCNFLEEPFPTDADGFLMSHIVTIYKEETTRALVKKAYDALPKGGKLIVYERLWSTDDETGPPLAAAMNCYFFGFATGHGLVFSMKVAEEWLKSAGFVEAWFSPEGIIAQK